MKESVGLSSPDLRIDSGLRVSVALPFRMVRRQMGFLSRNGLGLELALYDTNWICSFPTDKVAELSDSLKAAGIQLTVHGPIYDLNPGSLDAVIRDYTRYCFFKTLSVCHALGAKALVLHLGLNPLLPDGALGGWLDASIRTWDPIVDMAEQMGITIRLENMFTPSPKFLVGIMDGLKSDTVKICFDIGHFNVYSKTPLDDWLDEIGDAIDEVHLNDNNGIEDNHLELGKGKIDFSGFFKELARRGIDSDFTIEMTSDKFTPSLKYLEDNKLLKQFARA